MPRQGGYYFEVDCSLNHPAQDEKAFAAIEKISIVETCDFTDSWFKAEILGGLNGADIEFVDSSSNDKRFGVVGFRLTTHMSTVVLD